MCSALAGRVTVLEVVPLAGTNEDFDDRQRNRVVTMLVEYAHSDFATVDVFLDEDAVAERQRSAERFEYALAGRHRRDTER